jgi:2-keto-4-pentenoate hydratase/2-oxohepta-3-ene-1,7-dioic acid hydratase in catechol pathway
MKIIRYVLDGEKPSFGVLQAGVVFALEGDLFDCPTAGRQIAPLEDVRLLALGQPSKIIAAGRNYAAHAAEFDNVVPAEPLIFFKPPSAIIGPAEPIELPPQSSRVDHEAELVVVIGRRGRHIPKDQALDYVLGYTCGNDVTARDLQHSEQLWTRAKGFDTFAPLGPWIETELDPAELEITARVNGEVRQRANTRQLAFDVPVLINYISAVMTLEPGDLIFTGTPAGVSPLQPGDRVEVEVEGLGVLVNPVLKAGQ